MASAEMAESRGGPAAQAFGTEDRVLAELDALGISYLLLRVPVADGHVIAPRPPAELLAHIVQQPSARVRAALVPLLLARPGYASGARAAATSLAGVARIALMAFYTAAVCLQQELAPALSARLGADWRAMPDLFADDLGLRTEIGPGGRLGEVARRHALLTGQYLNWEGTYRDAASRLLRQWDREAQWTA